MLGFGKGFFSPSIRQLFRTRVHFITDTEGHHLSFVNSIKHSKIVRFDERGRLDFYPGLKDPYFIFGGDLTDRGLGDIKLTRILLEFKHRYQQRVILLVGNREASKTRFFVELNPKYIRERLLKGGVPFWLLSNPHQLPIDYVKKQMQLRNIRFDKPSDMEQYVESLSIEECQLIYLKWMLEQNLGCPYTFDYHAQQLADELACDLKNISELMVLKSILEHSSPHGLVGEYIKNTQIAAIIPNTGILAVHGGLTPENIGRLPTMKPNDPIITDTHSWIEQFNEWYRLEVKKWTDLKHEEVSLELQPARATLDTFSIRVPSEYKSIVTSSMLDEHRQFTEVPESVSNYLHQNNINLVLSGHQPCGDHPVLLRSKDDRVVFINGDISYANSKEKNVHDTRGLATHTLQILVNDQGLKIKIDACLATGKRVQNYLEIAEGSVVDDTHIGKILPGKELVQCLLEETGYYRTIHQKGFTVEYKFRTKSEIDLVLQSSATRAIIEQKKELVF